MTNRRRSYVATIHTKDAQPEALLPNWKLVDNIKRATFQLEKAPTTGGLHWQVFIELCNPSSFKLIRSQLLGTVNHKYKNFNTDLSVDTSGMHRNRGVNYVTKGKAIEDKRFVYDKLKGGYINDSRPMSPKIPVFHETIEWNGKTYKRYNFWRDSILTEYRNDPSFGVCINLPSNPKWDNKSSEELDQFDLDYIKSMDIIMKYIRYDGEDMTTNEIKNNCKLHLKKMCRKY